MNIWILDGDLMEQAIQMLDVQYQFGPESDKNKLILAIEQMRRIKDNAIKIQNGLQQALTEEITTVKIKRK